MTPDIGIDLGTSYIRIYVKGQGVLIQEPSVVAFNREMNEIVAIGEDAYTSLEHSKGNLKLYFPIQRGNIVDFSVSEKLLSHYILKATGNYGIKKHHVVIGVASNTTQVQKRVLISAARETGASEVELRSACFASAVAAGIEVFEPIGNLIVNIGGGHTDIELISMGSIVESTSLAIGGNDFDEVIVRYLKETYQLLISSAAAESIKMSLSNSKSHDESIEIFGRDLVSGIAKSILINPFDMIVTYHEYMDQIVGAIHSIVEKIHPELCVDLYERGIVLAGGGVLLLGLEEYIQEKTKLRTTIVQEPMLSVVNGCGRGI